MSNPPIKWTGQVEGGLASVRWFTGFSRLTGLYIGAFCLLIGTWFAIPFLASRRAGSEYFFAQLRGKRVGVLRRVWDTYRQFLAFVLCWHERTLAFLRGPGVLSCKVIGEVPRGQGVVLLTAHMGNFELGAWLLRKDDDRPVNVVMVDSEVDHVNAYMRTLRGAVQPRIIAVNHSPLSALAILAALKRGEIVCMQGDRATGSQEVQVPFLGRPAPFPLGPYLLARLAGAAVIPTLCRRLGLGRYEFQLYPSLDAGVPEDAARAYVQILEEETRARPYYWFNLFSFWDGGHRPEQLRAAG